MTSLHSIPTGDNQLTELALAVSTKFPVHALRADKRPATPHGFLDATQSAAAIREQFSQPDAALIGVRTGRNSGPDGLLVLDVDPDGLEWYEANKHRLPTTRTQKTRRGGYHVMFNMPEADVRSSAGKIAPGIDIRGNSGYVCWWRAEGLDVTNAETYADAPQWLVDAAAGGRAPAADDPLANVRERCDLTPEQSRKLLEHVEADSYDTWVMAGQALHHEYGDEGLELWADWSRGSDKYPGDAECAQKWASFGRYSGAPVTMRAVINAAKRTGATRELWSTTPPASAVFGPIAAAVKKALEFNIVYAGEYIEQQPPGWIVKDVVPAADLGLVYAESGAGKTFWIGDLALHMAAGLEYRGRTVKQQRVLYICAEGARGFSVRLRVMAKHLGLDLKDGSVQLDVLPGMPNFLDPQHVEAVIAEAKKRGRYDVAIVDTLAQVTPGGDENSAEDMGLALSHCRRLGDALGGMVVLVHHAGKDASKGARGWSGLRAAVDFEVAITRDGQVRKATLGKQKDGPDGDELYFTLVPEMAGVFDADGNEASSCYVRHDEPPAKAAAARKPLKGLPAIVYEAAVEACGMTGSAPVGAVVDEALRRVPEPVAGERDLRRQHIGRALRDAVAPMWVELLDNVVTLVAPVAPVRTSGSPVVQAPAPTSTSVYRNTGAVVRGAVGETEVVKS